MTMDRRIGGALIIMAASAAMPAHAAEPRALAAVIAEIDRQFVCPQFLRDADARRSELAAFSRALQTVGPRRVTYSQASYIRGKLLERHNCSNGVAAASPAAHPTQPAAMASAAR